MKGPEVRIAVLSIVKFVLRSVAYAISLLVLVLVLIFISESRATPFSITSSGEQVVSVNTSGYNF